MRAFITGINGFAGEHLARHLLASGDAVAGCTRYGERDGVHASSKLTIAWDLGQRTLNSAARQQLLDYAPDCIFHLAALSIPSRCGKVDPTPEAVQSNVEGTRELIEFASGLPKQPRIVFVSSSHVYGAVATESPTCSEETPCEPSSAYGKTKVAAETLVREAVRNGMEIVIARAFHHTGPGQLPPGMVPSWIEQLLDPKCESVKVMTLAANLDISDVRDVVAAYRLLAVSGVSGEAYNIGSGRGYFGGEIMDLLQRTAGITKPVVEDWATGRQNPIADCRRIFSQTGWQSQFTLGQTLQDSLAFWKSRKQ